MESEMETDKFNIETIVRYLDRPCKVAIRDCGDHLQFDLTGLFFLTNGSAMLLGSDITPGIESEYEIERRRARTVKLPPLILNFPKKLPQNITFEHMKDQVRKEAFHKFSNSFNEYKEAKKIKTDIKDAVESQPWNARYNLFCLTGKWLLDTGASNHVCHNKAMFSTYEPLIYKRQVWSGNGAPSDIVGTGKIVLKMASGQTLTLEDVLHAPGICANLISGSQLNKASFKLVFEVGKVILTKNNYFVGDGYVQNGLFVLNAITIRC